MFSDGANTTVAGRLFHAQAVATVVILPVTSLKVVPTVTHLITNKTWHHLHDINRAYLLADQ